ncbi:nucleotidyltransferase family protein [Microbulbifer sp. SAOS-129_SWC]|uniref:nucleotidyltransferase family protein n=1 Tax=Microbulbifer sp. SAOS-129_SWC TaxID=3145235 RepID=UPI0032168C6F
MDTIQPIILAAGASRRFGTCKLLLRYRGTSLLQRCADTLAALALPAPLIVSGAWHRQLADAHPQLALREHRDWRDGLGSSLAFAARQLPAHSEAALVLLADQVAVTELDLQQLLQAWRDQREARKTVCSFYTGRRGVPAIFPRHTFAQLQQLHGDSGARALLRSREAEVIEVPLANGAIDIDTPQDWKNFGGDACN